MVTEAKVESPGYTEMYGSRHLMQLCTGLLAVSPAVAAPDFNDGWKLETDTDGIRIYSRAVDGSQLKQIKATTEVYAPLDAVMAVLTDYTNYKSWIDHVTQSDVMDREGDSVSYVYTYESAAWPVQNRFCVTRMTHSIDDHHAIVTFESVPRYMKSGHDAIEIAQIRGYWKVTPRGAACNIEYMFYSDPGGHLPHWLVNQIAKEKPLKTLRNLRSVVEAKARP